MLSVSPGEQGARTRTTTKRGNGGGPVENLDAFPGGRQQLGPLLENIYLSVAEPERWQQSLHMLVELTRSRSARLLVMDAAAQVVRHSLKVNIDDSAHRDYVNHFVNTCPWRPELQQKTPGRLYSTYLDFSCRQPHYYRTEFYNDWARELDIHHGVCGTVDRRDGETVQLLIQRTRGQGPYMERETAAINSVLPHFRRALYLGRRIAAERVQSQAVTKAAESSRLPFFLIGEDGCVCYGSPAAERMLRDGWLPAPRRGRLRCFVDGDGARLRRLVGDCLRTAQGGGWSAGGSLLLHRPDGRWLHAMVTPVHPEMEPVSLFPMNRSFVAVFLHDPQTSVSLDLVRIAELYGLTDAEARVAGAVANGDSLEKLAASTGVSIHTVRSQLKAVFRKTGTRRQAALARLLLTSPGCHAEIGNPTGGRNSEDKPGRILQMR